MATTLTYTALDICTEALREAGVISLRRAASADEFNTALKRLNMMLKAMQNDSITTWKMTSGEISITADTESYEISTRPLELDTVAYKASSTASETWMYRMTRREYFELPDRSSTGQPTQFYYQPERETGQLYVWPVLGSATGTLVWNGKAEIEDVTETTDVVEVPGEWYEAILYGLAMRLSSAFKTQRPLLPSMAAAALAQAQGGDAEGSVFFEVGE